MIFMVMSQERSWNLPELSSESEVTHLTQSFSHLNTGTPLLLLKAGQCKLGEEREQSPALWLSHRVHGTRNLENPSWLPVWRQAGAEHRSGHWVIDLADCPLGSGSLTAQRWSSDSSPEEGLCSRLFLSWWFALPPGDQEEFKNTSVVSRTT